MGVTLPSVTARYKSYVTPGNVTFGNVRNMVDDSWKRLEGTWDRLRWARYTKYQRAKSAAAFAREIGIEEGTYRGYERPPGSSKTIALDHQKAMFLARKLGVRWEWLLDGKGEPYADPAEQVAAALREEVPPERQQSFADAIMALIRSGTHG